MECSGFAQNLESLATVWGFCESSFEATKRVKGLEEW